MLQVLLRLKSRSRCACAQRRRTTFPSLPPSSYVRRRLPRPQHRSLLKARGGEAQPEACAPGGDGRRAPGGRRSGNRRSRVRPRGGLRQPALRFGCATAARERPGDPRGSVRGAARAPLNVGAPPKTEATPGDADPRTSPAPATTNAPRESASIAEPACWRNGCPCGHRAAATGATPGTPRAKH